MRRRLPASRRASRSSIGDALDASSYRQFVRPGDTFVHLVGTPHPSPAKAAEFRRVDLPSILAAVSAAASAGVAHFVYVSVAQPAPIMHAYIAVRQEGEAAIAGAGLDRHHPAAVVRPGPGPLVAGWRSSRCMRRRGWSPRGARGPSGWAS